MPDGEPGGRRLWISWQIPVLRDVGRMCASIPHQDLAIQWDVRIEIMAWDGRWPNHQPFPGMEHVFAGNFARLLPYPRTSSLAFTCAMATSMPSTSYSHRQQVS